MDIRRIDRSKGGGNVAQVQNSPDHSIAIVTIDGVYNGAVTTNKNPKRISYAPPAGDPNKLYCLPDKTTYQWQNDSGASPLAVAGFIMRLLALIIIIIYAVVMLYSYGNNSTGNVYCKLSRTDLSETSNDVSIDTFSVTNNIPQNDNVKSSSRQ